MSFNHIIYRMNLQNMKNGTLLSLELVIPPFSLSECMCACWRKLSTKTNLKQLFVPVAHGKEARKRSGCIVLSAESWTHYRSRRALNRGSLIGPSCPTKHTFPWSRFTVFSSLPITSSTVPNSHIPMKTWWITAKAQSITINIVVIIVLIIHVINGLKKKLSVTMTIKTSNNNQTWVS